jgi:hypothetical protein
VRQAHKKIGDTQYTFIVIVTKSDEKCPAPVGPDFGIPQRSLESSSDRESLLVVLTGAELRRYVRGK